jgi:hypothetical protein
MGRPSGAHTHPPSGGAILAALLVGAGAVIVAGHAASPAVASAGRFAGELLTVALVAVAAVAGLGILALALLAYLHHRRPAPWQDRQVTPPSVAALEPPPARAPVVIIAPPARQAVTTGPAEVHHHHHWAGVDPATLAVALGHMRAPDEPAPAHLRAPDA